MSYVERAEEAQQEQLDWLSQIHEQEVAQTHLLREIAQHTRLLYVLTILGLICAGVFVLASVLRSA